MAVRKKTAAEINGPVKIQNHLPISRRDFLSKGFIAGMGYALAPTLLDMILQRHHSLAFGQTGADCGGIPALNLKIPVIIFDLSGGSNIAGSNVIVGDRGGQSSFLKVEDYASLGLPPTMTPDKPQMTNNELGLLFHSDSAILRGIQSVTTPVLRAKVDGGLFCSTSSDDTGNNPHNPMYWLSKAGATGDLGDLIGTMDTQSGGYSAAPKSSINPTKMPINVSSPQDALSLVNAGRLSSLLSADKVKRVLRATEKMSETQVNRFNMLSLPEQIKDLIACGYLQSQDIIGRYSPEQINPTLDATVNQAFNDLNNGDQRKTATVSKLVLDGHIGAATIEKGGYDYHTNDRQVGETRDFEIGSLIGRVMTLASLKQKDVLIYVFTDGGVSAQSTVDGNPLGRGKYIWTGDSSQRSSSMMLLYRHAGRATIRTAGMRQIGAFKSGGSVDLGASLASDSVINLNKAFVANFLALHGEEGSLANIVGDNPFGADLNKYLFFNKIK